MVNGIRNHFALTTYCKKPKGFITKYFFPESTFILPVYVQFFTASQSFKSPTLAGSVTLNQYCSRSDCSHVKSNIYTV